MQMSQDFVSCVRKIIWGEVKFLHIGLPAGVVLGKVSATYHAPMVTTDTADNKCEAIVAIETSSERSRLAHKAACPLPESGRGVKRAAILA